jgi:hypothetical protein
MEKKNKSICQIYISNACIKHTVMNNNWFDDESDDNDDVHAEESGSETENVDSESIEDEKKLIWRKMIQIKITHNDVHTVLDLIWYGLPFHLIH